VSYRLQASLALIAKVHDLLLERLNNVLAAIDAGAKLATFTLPTHDPVDLSHSSALLGVDLLAQLAFLAYWHRCHNQLHTTGFTRAVLAVAVLTEVAPLPIAALESVLVKEAHYGCVSGKAGVSRFS